MKVELTEEELEALQTFFDDLCAPEGTQRYIEGYIKAYLEGGFKDRSLILTVLRKLTIIK